MCSEVQHAHDCIQFNPGSESYLYHIGLCILPRQILTDGDPGSRACDVCEAAGAHVKYSLHNLCCKRKVSGTTKHSKSRDNAECVSWEQSFTVSRVVQTFRRMVMRRKLIDDPTYAHLLQRQDVEVKKTGQASKRVKSFYEGMSQQQIHDLSGAVGKSTKSYEWTKLDAKFI